MNFTHGPPSSWGFRTPTGPTIVVPSSFVIGLTDHLCVLCNLATIEIAAIIVTLSLVVVTSLAVYLVTFRMLDWLLRTKPIPPFYHLLYFYLVERCNLQFRDHDLDGSRNTWSCPASLQGPSFSRPLQARMILNLHEHFRHTCVQQSEVELSVSQRLVLFRPLRVLL
jgi:hypothetical protein